MFATTPSLAVGPPAHATFAVIASPAGPYFASGVTGIRLWVSTDYTGGRGRNRRGQVGGNYAAGLAAQVQAQQYGCDQVLYVDGAEHRWLEESGTMNLVPSPGGGELVTPGLGTILEGVTLDSVLELAAEHGLSPVERRVGLDELRSCCRDGSNTEVFAAGTAAVITPVTSFRGPNNDRRDRRRRCTRPTHLGHPRPPAGHPARSSGRHRRVDAPGALSAVSGRSGRELETAMSPQRGKCIGGEPGAPLGRDGWGPCLPVEVLSAVRALPRLELVELPRLNAVVAPV